MIASPWAKKAHKAGKAPVCLVPPPTPGAPYTAYAEGSRCAEAVLMPTGGTRRRLTAAADACFETCSLVGFASPFYLNVQTSTGDCYWCVGQIG